MIKASLWQDRREALFRLTIRIRMTESANNEIKKGRKKT